MAAIFKPESSSGGFCVVRRVNRPRADSQTVPRIDHGDRDRQVHELLLGELTPGVVVDLVGRVRDRMVHQEIWLTWMPPTGATSARTSR